MKAKDIKLDLVNNTWREVITLSSTLYTEITTVFVKTLKKFDSWTVTRLSKLEGGELLTSDLLVFEENLTVCMLGYTAINAQVATRLLTSCNRLAINKPISGCVCLACDSFLTTSLLQAVNRRVASLLSKLVILRCVFNKL